MILFKTIIYYFAHVLWFVSLYSLLIWWAKQLPFCDSHPILATMVSLVILCYQGFMIGIKMADLTPVDRWINLNANKDDPKDNGNEK